MTPKDLAPGRYRLTADVANPSQDKRNRTDWRRCKPAFKAGDTFEVEEGPWSRVVEGVQIIHLQVVLSKSRFSHQHLSTFTAETTPTAEDLRVDANRRLLWALLPHLERVDDAVVRNERVEYATANADDLLERADMATYTEVLADLREAAATLRRYEVLHRAKGTADSDAKAEVNAKLAARFEATLARATPTTTTG